MTINSPAVLAVRAARDARLRNAAHQQFPGISDLRLRPVADKGLPTEGLIGHWHDVLIFADPFGLYNDGTATFYLAAQCQCCRRYTLLAPASDLLRATVAPVTTVARCEHCRWVHHMQQQAARAVHSRWRTWWFERTSEHTCEDFLSSAHPTLH